MGERARILIVDDDESVRKALATVLEDKGYRVDTAENGREAVRKSETTFYNLALIDVGLSDMEVTKLLTALRKTTSKMVKIIIGYPSVQNAVAAANKDADDYWVKPLNIPLLLRTIKAHLKKQRRDRELIEERVAGFVESKVRQIENGTTPRKRTAEVQRWLVFDDFG